MNYNFRWIQNFIRLGKGKIRTDSESSPVSQQTANIHILLLPVPNKVLDDSCCRFRDSLFHHAEFPEDASSHVFVQGYRSTSITTTIFCSNKFPFFNSVWTTCRLLLVSYIRSLLWWICHSRLKVFKHSEHLYLGYRKPNRDSTTWATQHICNSLVSCVRPIVWSVHTTWIMFQTEEAIIIRWWTPTYAQKLNNSRKMQFKQDGSPPNSTGAVHSLPYDMFPNWWTGKYDKTGWPGRSSILPHWTFLSWNW